MDDETYVKRDYRQLPGNVYYVSSVRGKVNKKFKYVCVDKFAPKVLVWQAICECGLKSKAFATTNNMNENLYIKECMQNRLLPFIRSHKGPTLFWPDLASCHYSKKTLNWYQENNVKFICKNNNPPNCPAFRPIEKFWAVTKRILKKTKRTVKDAKSLLNSWNNAARKIRTNVVQNLMGGIRRKMRLYLRESS